MAYYYFMNTFGVVCPTNAMFGIFAALNHNHTYYTTSCAFTRTSIVHRLNEGCARERLQHVHHVMYCFMSLYSFIDNVSSSNYSNCILHFIHRIVCMWSCTRTRLKNYNNIDAVVAGRWIWWWVAFCLSFALVCKWLLNNEDYGRDIYCILI